MTVKMQIDPRSLVYPVHIRPDEYANGDIAYIAEIPDLPGCKAHGRTPEEARSQLDEAKVDYIQALADEGLDIPAPRCEPSYTWQTVIVGGEPTPAPMLTQGFPPRLGGAMLHTERAADYSVVPTTLA